MRGRFAEFVRVEWERTVRRHPCASGAFARLASPSAKRRAARALILSLSLLVSLAAAVLFAEMYLARRYPNLRNIGATASVIDADRLHVNPRWDPSSGDGPPFTVQTHPDTGRPHLCIYNSLGGRQSREVAFGDVRSVVLKVAVLGDSFTDNDNLPAQESYSEVLDYLLNAVGRPAEVLNQGRGNYGADQVYLTYFQDVRPLRPDVVFYQFYANDFKNIEKNEIFDLDREGRLVRMNIRRRPLPPWLRGSTLFNFARARWPLFEERVARRGLTRQAEEAERNQRARRVPAIFRRLLAEMRDDIEARGGVFLAGIAPTRRIGDERSALGRAALAEFGVPVVEGIQDYSRAPEQKLGGEEIHWNALGNRVFGVAVFKALAERFHVEYVETGLCAFLSAYYSAFGPLPFTEDGCVSHEGPTPEARAIRARYLELENPGLWRGESEQKQVRRYANAPRLQDLAEEAP